MVVDYFNEGGMDMITYHSSESLLCSNADNRKDSATMK